MSQLLDDAGFASFLDEVTREVAAYAEPWRVRLGQAAARWRAEGFDVSVLERALRLVVAPDVDVLLGTFEQAVARLRALAREAASYDRARTGDAVFRDPTRVAEASALVAALGRVAAERPSAGHPAASPVSRPAVTAENWVLEWPDVGDLLVEEWR